MDSEELVSIYTVGNPVEAEIIRGALESEGIACEINGETQAGFVGMSMFEIDIMTTLADADRARKCLRELGHHKESMKPQESDEHKNAIQEHKPGSHIQPPTT